MTVAGPAIAAELRRAMALHGQGDIAAAAHIYRAILARQPRHFDALHLLGVVHMQQGDFPEAERLIRAALATDAQNGPALSNLGVVLRSARKTIEALQVLDRAVAVQPGSAENHFNRAHVLIDLERFTDALAACDRAIALKPDHAGAHENRGVVLDRLGRFDDAVTAFNQALQLHARSPEIFFNLGHALYSLGRVTEAREAFIAAATAKADFAEAYVGVAECLLLVGAMKEGWPLYEWRHATRLLTGGGGGTLWPMARAFDVPQWRGEDLTGKTILLHADHGYGDAFHFCRYVPAVAARGAHVLLETQPPLKKLLAGLEGVAQVYARGEVLPAFDLHCPLMSLPLAFGTTPETIPAIIPYITAPSVLTAGWRNRFSGDPQLRVGLAWFGVRGPVKEMHRSIPPTALAPLLACDADFVSLQKDLRPEDLSIDMLRNRVQSFSGEISDFADTAALIAALDLVITVDTAVAHLAAAMGKPVWLLLCTVPDWRWGLEGDTTAWYPTTRLFRQPAPGAWEPVIAAAAEALSRLTRRGRAE